MIHGSDSSHLRAAGAGGPRKPEELHRDHDGKMRVAAYCRVSTDSEEQLNSYEAQKTYYTQKIQDSPDWEMAGIHADEGISGTSLKNGRSSTR